MAAKGGKLQTSVRLDPDDFRECQYYLSLEGMSFTRFVAESMQAFLRQYRAAHPECVPRGKSTETVGTDIPAPGSRVLVAPDGS
jgi:hypothetical protein